MLSDDKQATVYAHLLDAVENWGMLLDVLYDAILDEEKPILTNMSRHLDKALTMLEPVDEEKFKVVSYMRIDSEDGEGEPMDRGEAEAEMSNLKLMQPENIYAIEKCGDNE